MCVFIIKNKDIYSKFYLTSGWHVLCQEKDQFKAAKMSYFTSIDWYCVSHQPINNAQNILFPDRLSAHSKHKMHINRKRIKSKQPYLQQLCVCLNSVLHSRSSKSIRALICRNESWPLSAAAQAQSLQGQRSAWAEGMSCFLSTHH